MNRVLIVATILVAYRFFEHVCNHSEMKKRREKLDKGDSIVQVTPSDDFPSEERLLADDGWHSINIVFDTSMIEGITEDQKLYIVNAALPVVKANFATFVSVRGSGVIPKFRTNICGDDVLSPDSYRTSATTGDLVIFVKTVADDGDTLASAVYCAYESQYNRPIIGFMNLNPKKLKISAPSLQAMILTIMHEVIHILVLHPNHYGNYYGSNYAIATESRTTVSGTSTVYKLVTPKIVAAAKEQFGCSTLTGVYLEDEGSSASAGAHFEKKHYGNELMTSILTGYQVISKVLLALMEDSGWYQVDYTKAQDLAYGYKKGCTFLEEACPATGREFCTTDGAKSCSVDYTAKTRCMDTTFTGTCLTAEYFPADLCTNQYNFSKTWKHEEPGPSSRCFVSTVSSKQVGLCLKSTCENGEILIQVKEETIKCTTSGAVVEYGSTKITCPDISEFCNYVAAICPNDCSGYGACLLGGTCRCDFFYEGSTCSTEKTCPSEVASICTVLQSGATALSNTVVVLLAIIKILA